MTSYKINDTSPLEADEYSGYLFVWITMIGFAQALQEGAFLRVDSLVQRLGRRGQAAADLVSALTGLAVAAACTYATVTASSPTNPIADPIPAPKTSRATRTTPYIAAASCQVIVPYAVAVRKRRHAAWSSSR